MYDVNNIQNLLIMKKTFSTIVIAMAANYFENVL